MDAYGGAAGPSAGTAAQIQYDPQSPGSLHHYMTYIQLQERAVSLDMAQAGLEASSAEEKHTSATWQT